MGSERAGMTDVVGERDDAHGPTWSNEERSPQALEPGSRAATGAVAGGAGAATDISTPTHVHDLVITFYREVVFDEVLEPVFGEVAEVDWAEHIPKLIDYWCWILLGRGGPSGTVTKAHRHLHALAPIRAEHCDRWFVLWVRSVDARWAGPTAALAKDHATTLMTGLAKHVFGFAWAPPQPG